MASPFVAVFLGTEGIRSAWHTIHRHHHDASRTNGAEPASIADSVVSSTIGHIYCGNVIHADKGATLLYLIIVASSRCVTPISVQFAVGKGDVTHSLALGSMSPQDEHNVLPVKHIGEALPTRSALLDATPFRHQSPFCFEHAGI